MTPFAQQLAWGQRGETLIADYLMARHECAIMPVYDKPIDSGKGPQVFTFSESFAAPDMLMFSDKGARWIEAKRKTSFTYHRMTGTWQTGIDRNHYADYLRVLALGPWPLWLMFLQLNGTAKDTPLGKVAPTGLYGGNMAKLRDEVDHEHANHGRHGMVYWREASLSKFAELADMHALVGGSIAA